MDLIKRKFNELKQKKISAAWVIAIVIIALLINNNFKKDPSVKSQAEVKGTVTEVGKLIDLPKDEEPSLAEVKDVEKLKDQPFFAKAQNGDKVLIYQQNGRAILYRPSTKKIIEVMPINFDKPEVKGAQNQTQSTTPFPTKIQSMTVSLYLATDSDSVLAEVENKIKRKYPQIQIVSKEKAKKKDYTDHLVVDLKGDKRDIVEDIASIIGGKVSALMPEEEIAPPSEILIIVK